MELETAGHRAADVATVLGEAARRIDTSHPRTATVGANGPGALGELGRAWAAKMSEALVARADESRSLADAATGLAGAAGVAALAYRETESRRAGA